MEVERSTIPGLSFPTDLLFNLDAVRKQCTADLATHNACLTMLKGRLQLEQYYAAELSRLADQFRIEDDIECSDRNDGGASKSEDARGEDDRPGRSSSLKEALRGLKAQYTNTSVQHKALATNLEEDVYRPMHTLYKYLAKKESKLTVCTTRVRKQTKAFEDLYRRQHSKFEKQFKDATTTYAQAMEIGIAGEIIHNQYLASPVHHRQQQQQQQQQQQARPPAEYLQPVPNDHSPQHSPDTVKVTSPAKSPHSSHITASEGGRPRSNSMSRASLDGTKLVNWLLPSGQQKKENLLLTSVKAIENAEVARHECRAAWNGFEDARVALFRSIQSILNDYQHLAEYSISNLTSSLRKHVIFESSALANSQYDWQMLASVMEAVDAEGDIRAFILAHQRMVLPTMTVNDLCRADTLPLPPPATSLAMTDIKARKCPVDAVGNGHTVYGWLATRSDMVQDNLSEAPIEQPRAAAASADDIKHPEVPGIDTCPFHPKHLDAPVPPADRPESIELDNECCVDQC
ncbi:hypothetical protein, variant [Aphanomyces invadans]|uniref:FCH domain-containing protein n=1 Tax=Aphanomyces invadans TaxID=157072 RepID=A0A024UVD7_9STRA|nr:hypothetical protein, variant [Aphanomyces invadans]ETW10319.1 hypothetical protein, variant [Aphanomyces invadans]|eukprot:XP_008861730.1 hypothetical protein, variant [Aphanomyces invadans]